MKILNGTRDGRARESRHTGDECNTSSPQLFGIDGSDKVLLSLIQVGEQRSVFLLKFFLFAHTVSITRGASFVTIIILQALINVRLTLVATPTTGGIRILRVGLNEHPSARLLSRVQQGLQVRCGPIGLSLGPLEERGWIPTTQGHALLCDRKQIGTDQSPKRGTRISIWAARIVDLGLERDQPEILIKWESGGLRINSWAGPSETGQGCGWGWLA